MKKPSNKLVILFVVIAAIASCSLAWSTVYPSAKLRYKLTVSVNTPEGVRTGSSVKEVHLYRAPAIPEDTGGHAKVKGEAVTIDLGKRGLLFAVSSTDDAYYILFRAFLYKGALTKEGIEYYSTLKGKKVLTPDNYPMLVRFADLNDPKSIKLVVEKKTPELEKRYRAEDMETFAEAFGEGVSIKEVTLEITDEPVTTGIEKYLPWLPTVWKGSLDGQTLVMSNKLSNTLHQAYFKWGF